MNNRSTHENGGKHKKNKAGTLFGVFLLIAALLGGGYVVAAKAVVGWQTTDISVESVTVGENRIELNGELNGFAGLKDYSYAIDEDTVLVTLNCTWPVLGRDGDFSIELEDDFSDILEVNVTDGRNRLVVWIDE